MFKEHQHDPLLDSPEQRMKDGGVMIICGWHGLIWCVWYVIYISVTWCSTWT